jgi:hypothetical protein
MFKRWWEMGDERKKKQNERDNEIRKESLRCGSI